MFVGVGYLNALSDLGVVVDTNIKKVYHFVSDAAPTHEVHHVVGTSPNVIIRLHKGIIPYSLGVAIFMCGQVPCAIVNKGVPYVYH
jgi:hypothetical protein